MTQFVCEVCTYPARHGEVCDNPGCVANPSVSAKQKEAWRAEAGKRAAEEAERKRIMKIRRRSYGHGAGRTKAGNDISGL